MQDLEQRALSALVALGAILAVCTVAELARLLQLRERLHSTGHDCLLSLVHLLKLRRLTIGELPRTNPSTSLLFTFCERINITAGEYIILYYSLIPIISEIELYELEKGA